MIGTQLGWAMLTASSQAPDQQVARAAESGSYGELMDLIDRVIEEAEAAEEAASPPQTLT
jgi:hypothetical protein